MCLHIPFLCYNKNMNKNCTECEKDLILRCSDLAIKCDKLEKYNALLEKCLDTKEELNKVLREDNEALRNKLRILNN